MFSKANNEERHQFGGSPATEVSGADLGWYRRVENNGWRPLAVRLQEEKDKERSQPAGGLSKYGLSDPRLKAAPT